MPDKKTSFSVENLLNSKIVTSDGKRIGWVTDLQLSPGPEYRIIALIYGTSGLLHRLHVLHPFAKVLRLTSELKTITWDEVASVKQATIKLKPGQRVSKEVSSESYHRQ